MYDHAVHETWHHSDLSNPSLTNQALVRYATLAASSHNTQPWKFKLEPTCISILPDLTRRCPEADPDDHHLFASLGCATENLLLAADAAGLRGKALYEPKMAVDGAIRINLKKATRSRSSLFEAIPARRCSRAAYDDSRATAEELRLLEQAGRGNGVAVLLLTSPKQKEAVAGYVAQGNAAQIGNRRWVAELERWIRFSQREAMRSRDGLYARCAGNPRVPRFIGELLMRLAFSAESQSSRDIRNIRSSAGIAVFFSEADDIPHWIEVGRSYERFALQATALGIRNAFVNQPVEVAGLRAQFAAWLGIGSRRPDLVVRFGRGGPEMPHSLRRPVEEVIV